MLQRDLLRDRGLVAGLVGVEWPKMTGTCLAGIDWMRENGGMVRMGWGE